MLFHIVNGPVHNILGHSAIDKMGLLKRVNVIKTVPASADTETEKIIRTYSDVFQGVGTIKGVAYKIDIDDNVSPVVHPPRQIPVAKRPKVKEELDRLEKLHIIEKVSSDWVNSLVVVYKGDKVRIVLLPKT